jgi:RNA polymerase sigma-54 factor
MELGLDLRQAQTLSPQMMQAMEILQMGSQELLEYIQEALQENPVLENEEARQSQEDPEDALLRRKLEWLASTDVQNRWYHQEDARDLTDAVAGASGADPGEESLYYYLRSQVPFEELDGALAAAVEYVLASLNGSGWLDEPVADLAAHAGLGEPVMERAISLVQGLEPPGVAARNLSECLSLQLKRRGETGLPLTIAAQYLEDMGKDHYNRIAQATGASREEIQAACKVIRSLDPRPGAEFAPREALRYITPDLVVVNFEDHFEILTNDYYFPTLKVSAYYQQLMKSTDEAQVKDYLTGKVKQARWVVRSVEQRRSTLMNCAKCIVERQEAFFRRGPGHLRPMTLADVAAVLQVHESTVSRAVKDKYLQCAHGVFPLGYFFSRALSATGCGGSVSVEQAKTALKALIDGENKKKPLSDQKLCELLAGQGIEISRRTVAKYRDELGIPSTSGRKEF